MNYRKLEVHRRFERGNKDQATLGRLVGGAPGRPTRPAPTLSGEECMRQALELIDSYEGSVDWMLEYRTAREADPQWRPTDSEAALIVRTLYDDPQPTQAPPTPNKPHRRRSSRPGRATSSSVGARRPFPARYNGSCCRCNNPFSVGQLIVRVGKGYAHAGCRQTKEQYAMHNRRRTEQIPTSNGFRFDAPQSR